MNNVTAVISVVVVRGRPHIIKRSERGGVRNVSCALYEGEGVFVVMLYAKVHLHHKTALHHGMSWQSHADLHLGKPFQLVQSIIFCKLFLFILTRATLC